MPNIQFQITNNEKRQFQKKILDWYSLHQRKLPWRETRDPYAILISEVMSQQTQIARVIPKYLAWMEKFPTLTSLAQASTRDILAMWSGLGYNRRALYLQKLAQKLVSDSTQIALRGSENQKVRWPKTEKELLQLPGIGKYTARAILCFAFDQQIAVLDTNVRRVILTSLKLENGNLKLVVENRKKKLDKKISSFKLQDSNTSFQHLASSISDKELEKIAESILPVGHAYEWNQALMDYAATQLKYHKIPIPKQSTFKNSDRYYRGAIVRSLLAVNSRTIKQLQKDFSALSHERLSKILIRMQKDTLLIKKGNKYSLE